MTVAKSSWQFFLLAIIKKTEAEGFCLFAFSLGMPFPALVGPFGANVWVQLKKTAAEVVDVLMF